MASSTRRWAAPAEPGPQAGQLAPGDVHAQRVQLGHDGAVAAGGVGLALERAQLAADLAQQVLEAGEVGLGGLEPALALLLAAAELQHAGRFLDDRAGAPRGGR